MILVVCYKDCAKVRIFCAKFFQLLCSWWAVKSFFEVGFAFKIVSKPAAIELPYGESPNKTLAMVVEAKY